MSSTNNKLSFKRLWKSKYAENKNAYWGNLVESVFGEYPDDPNYWYPNKEIKVGDEDKLIQDSLTNNNKIY